MSERPPSRNEARDLLERLRGSAGALRDRPLDEILTVLGRVGSRFLDPGDPLREEAESRIPDEASVSRPMATEVVQGMARDWTRERLETLVRADFPDPGVLDGFRPGPGGDRIRALGGTLTLHVGAGSVPGVTATSLIRSLLVKSPALVKPGRGDRVLPRLVARAIEEEDAALARSVAVVYWPGGEGDALEEEALARVDRVVVYGGNETVRALRERLPPTLTLVAYHHRVSVGMVARECLAGEEEARRLAWDAARAVATFDQRGCVSPQVIWVEEGGTVAPEAWARLLAEGLEQLDASLPPGLLEEAVASEIQQLRGSAAMREAAGRGDRVFGGRGGRWTVLFESDPAFAPSCLGRTIRVKVLETLEAGPEVLSGVGDVLQSVALEAGPERRPEMAERLAREGVTRVTTFRDQPWPAAWWRHDGKGPLEALVRWTSLEE